MNFMHYCKKLFNKNELYKNIKNVYESNNLLLKNTLVSIYVC